MLPEIRTELALLKTLFPLLRSNFACRCLPWSMLNWDISGVLHIQLWWQIINIQNLLSAWICKGILYSLMDSRYKAMLINPIPKLFYTNSNLKVVNIFILRDRDIVHWRASCTQLFQVWSPAQHKMITCKTQEVISEGRTNSKPYVSLDMASKQTN